MSASLQPTASSCAAAIAAVVPGRFYVLRAAAFDDAGKVSDKALVAQVRFLDGEGRRIDGADAGCSSSERFGDFVYLPSVAHGAEPAQSRAAIRAPEGAAQVSIALYRWKASPALRLAGPVEVVDERETALTVMEFEVTGGGQYELELFMEDVEVCGQAAVVAVEYLDTTGALVPGPYAGCSSSERFGAYRYAGTRQDADEPVKVRLQPPITAARLVVRIFRWRGTPALRLRQAPVLRTANFEAPASQAVREAMQAIEALPPQKAGPMLDALLVEHGDSPAVLSAALEVLRRLGDLTRLEALARRVQNVPGKAMPGRLRAKASHMLSMIRELDTHWLPDPGGCPPMASRVMPRETEGLRVAHLFKTTIPHENTGGAIRCMNIVRFQKRLGMEPLVVTPLGYPERNANGQAWEREEIDGIPYFRLNGISREQARGIPVTVQLDFTAMLTAQLLRGQAVDLVHAHSGYRGYEQALVGLAVARRLGVPFVYEVRSYHEHTWRPMADWVLEAEMTRRRMEQENRCMREADAVVTICETMKEGLIARGIPEDKIFVVPNSVDLDQFTPQPPDLALKRQLGLNAATVAGYISNLSAREGHAVLLRAVAAARSRGADLDCLIVGAGPELERLQALAGELGIAGHVVFTGEVPHHEINRYYALIDLFVVPRVKDFASDYVTPMKPFEAMAMRRCVVASNRPALKEIIEDHVRGILFETADAMNLAEKIAQLCDAVHVREELATAAREWVCNERCWDKTVIGYKWVYQSTLDRYNNYVSEYQSDISLIDRVEL